MVYLAQTLSQCVFSLHLYQWFQISVPRVHCQLFFSMKEFLLNIHTITQCP